MSELLSSTSFNKFLQSGQLGKINLSASKQEVYRYLGEPVFSNIENWETNSQKMTNLYYDSFLITILDEEIAQISSRVVVNKAAMKTKYNEIQYFIEKLQDIVS